MGLRKFIRNIKFLSKFDLKKTLNYDNIVDKDYIDFTINNLVENLRYEIPGNLWNVTKPKIYDLDKTLDFLCNTDKSFVRFGDGEILVMNKESIGFQEYNEKLSERLREIIKSDNENILVGINYQYYYSEIDLFHDYVKFVFHTFINQVRKQLDKMIDINKQYYSTGVTGVYTTFKEWDFENWYNKFRTIWDKKNITIICGDRVFKNIKYNIYDNASKINYIHIPSINAFNEYSEILEKAKKIDKNDIVIIIAGPTAKVLAYDLSNIGYRCLDLGHLAKDYDAYKIKMKTNRKNIGKFYEPD